MAGSGWAVRGTAVALCALVSACGDGGGGSVASAGSSGPPPAGVNVNLLGPLKSETFANTASQGAVTISGTGTTGTASATTATFAYNAANQTYTMTVGGKSQSFAPANIDAGLSSVAATAYVITNGNTADSLTLTKPGTSGAFNYEYVGGALWQNTNVFPDVDGAKGAVDAVAYGEQTPATAVPTAGQGLYAVDLLGAEAHTGTVTGITGTGTLGINFASGTLALGGTLADGNRFASIGKMTSSGTFSGDFQISNASNQTGQLNGQLYGPGAQEIGATFSNSQPYYSGYVDTFVATGVILGRQATASTDTGFDAITQMDALAGDHIQQSATSVGAAATAQVMVLPLTVDGINTIVASPNYGGTFLSAPINQPSGSAAGQALYTFAGQTGLVPQLYPSTSYVRNAIWVDSTGTTPAFDTIVYGFQTPASAIPTTGFAGYGVNADAILQTAGASPVEVSGAGDIDVNFATGRISTEGDMKTVASNGLNGPTMGWTGTATLGSGTTGFAGTLSLAGAQTYSGAWQGRLYGPAANEIGAVFGLTGSDGSTMTGSMTGQASSALTALEIGLTNLMQGIPLSVGTDVAYLPATETPAIVTSEPAPTISYDVSSNTYTIFGNSYTVGAGRAYDPATYSVTLGSANQDPANSSATFTAYAGPDYTARVFNPGAGNPVIQLTYTSFAEITRTELDTYSNTSYAVTTYVAFGLPTPVLAMPVTGSASYSGVVYGTGILSNVAISVVGTGGMSANFGTGQFAATLDLNLPVTAANPQMASTLTYNGTISGNTFSSGSPTSPGGGALAGGMSGTFNGPAANEVGATWTAGIPTSTGFLSGSGLAGVFVGKRN